MKTTRMLKSVAAVTMLVGVSLSVNANIVKDLGAVSVAAPTVFDSFSAPGGYFSLPANSGLGYSALSLSLGPSAAGSYYLNVSGLTRGSMGGAYSGGISATPEPETYAMLLAGLGVMGAIARRRRV